MWTRLYSEPGFGIWLRNFTEIFTDEKANAEFSAWFADRIRERVHDPELAEKLIPRDHGVGVQRLPLETNYFEAYNRDNVRLVDVSETPIERITPDRHPHQRARPCPRRHRLRHRLRRHHRRLRPHRHPRRRWSDPAREVARRPVDLFRRAGARVPEPGDADGPAELLGLDELSARHRDRCQLGHRAPRVHVGQRLRARGGDSGGRAGVDGARHADVRHHAPAQGPVLVHRLQLERRRPRGRQRPLPRLHRRHAEVREEDLRDDAQRLRRHHLRVRDSATPTPLARGAPASRNTSPRFRREGVNASARPQAASRGNRPDTNRRSPARGSSNRSRTRLRPGGARHATRPAAGSGASPMWRRRDMRRPRRLVYRYRFTSLGAFQRGWR